MLFSVNFSSDNLKIVSGSNHKSIKIWDAQTGQLLNTLIGHSDYVLSVAFSNPINNSLNIKLKEYIKALK